MDSLRFSLLRAILIFIIGISAANASYSISHKRNLLKSQAILTQSTEVAALGRVADLGDLYDARSDNFVEISLYTTDLSGDAIHSTDNAFAAIDYVRTESFSEKMEKLGVSASLSVSFLGGLVSASGSGKYLNEDKRSAKSAKTSLIYSIRTVREDLKIFSKTSRSLIDNFLLENIDATHVVVGIEWGADVVLSLEETNTDSSNAQEIQGKLEAALNLAVLSVSGSAEVDFGSSDVESSSSFSLHINGDIIPNTVPQTINESISFIRSIPDLIKNENGGKGKIMKYILMPLPTVQKVFQAESNKTGIVNDIDQELIDQFMVIFQEMKDSELAINDVYNSVYTWKLMVPESDFSSISDLKSKFDSFTNDLRVQFADSVVQFRNGDLDDEALSELITSYRNSNWTSANVNTFLDAFTATMHKVRLLDLFQSFNAIFIDRRTDSYKILSDNYQTEVRILSVDLSIDISSPYVFDIVKLLEIESGKDSGGITYYINDTSIDVPEVKVYLDGKVIKSFPVIEKEYIFVKDDSGKVIIIDANSYEEVSSYNLPDIAESVVAIVNGTFYNIDTREGVIMSTSVEEMLTEQSAKNWTQVGSFPLESIHIYNSAVVNNSVIYFVTYSGVFYSYDITLKAVTKISTLSNSDVYASLVIVNSILYINKETTFYSFDGVTVKEIATPETRYDPGLFQFGNYVCRVGGNSTDIGLNPDPVSCFNPSDGTWTVTGYINQYRRYPGITSTKLGTYIFGGLAHQPTGSGNWLYSVEVFNPKTKIWSYVPSPLTNEPQFVQTVTFYF